MHLKLLNKLLLVEYLLLHGGRSSLGLYLCTSLVWDVGVLFRSTNFSSWCISYLQIHHLMFDTRNKQSSLGGCEKRNRAKGVEGKGKYCSKGSVLDGTTKFYKNIFDTVAYTMNYIWLLLTTVLQKLQFEFLCLTNYTLKIIEKLIIIDTVS